MVQENEPEERRIFGTDSRCGQEREEGWATDEVGPLRQGGQSLPLICAVESECGLSLVTGDDRHGFRSGRGHCGVERPLPASRSHVAIDFVP